jgi:hypothetical protein
MVAVSLPSDAKIRQAYLAMKTYVDLAVAAGGGGGGDMLAANNLSDLVNTTTARTNLGLGSAALSASTAFDAAGAATSAQAAAIAASQPLDTDLTAIAAVATTAYGRALLALADAAAGRTAFGLGTAATTAATDYATSAQGTLATNAIPKSIVGAKGTIVTGTAASTPSGLVVGADGLFLKADSVAANGISWAAIPGGGDMLKANNCRMC